MDNHEQLYQLAKQAISSKDHKSHMQALFNALHAKRENNSSSLSVFPLARDYYIALYGGEDAEQFFKK